MIEGGELFHNKEIGKLIDIKIFLDTDADIRISRRSKFISNEISTFQVYENCIIGN